MSAQHIITKVMSDQKKVICSFVEKTTCLSLWQRTNSGAGEWSEPGTFLIHEKRITTAYKFQCSLFVVSDLQTTPNNSSLFQKYRQKDLYVNLS
jgi:hypothetical protein